MPGYVDKQLTCVDCQAEFVFSAREQERFAELKFTNDPKRCGPCRAAKKRAAGGSPGGGGGRPPSGTMPREFHVARCAECGQEARVPFKPRGDRPVYCSTCYETQQR